MFLQEDKGAISMVAKLCSLKVWYGLLAQEKAEQDEELRLVHEDRAGNSRAEKELRNEVEAEKQTTAALEEVKSGLMTEVRELQPDIDARDEELEAKSARVSDLESKEQLAQLREDLFRTSSRLVEARNGETEKTAELTDQMRRLHDGFGSTERQNRMLKGQLHRTWTSCRVHRT